MVPLMLAPNTALHGALRIKPRNAPELDVEPVEKACPINHRLSDGKALNLRIEGFSS